MNLRKDFTDQADMLVYLREQFPDASGALSPFPGGRAAADLSRQSFNASRYAASRNYLNGTGDSACQLAGERNLHSYLLVAIFSASRSMPNNMPRKTM